MKLITGASVHRTAVLCTHVATTRVLCRGITDAVKPRHVRNANRAQGRGRGDDWVVEFDAPVAELMAVDGEHERATLHLAGMVGARQVRVAR